MANGRVSSRGASELSEPSLFLPNRRLINEPVQSPIMQPRPRNDPTMKAVPHSPPTQNQSSGSAPIRGRKRSGDQLVEANRMDPLWKPAPITAPINPFQVFPSPSSIAIRQRTSTINRARFDTCQIRIHFPPSMAAVLARYPGRYNRVPIGAAPQTHRDFGHIGCRHWKA